jgi:uncharacterized protein
MLTTELVRARRRGRELELVALGKRRERAEELASALLAIAGEHVGRSRGELAQAFGEIAASPQDKKLALGLAKLVEDACQFSSEAEIDPAVLRSAVFLRASAERRALEPGRALDRIAVLAEAGRPDGLDAEAVDAALFADLRSAHVLVRAARLAAGTLLERYENAQRQAVLLRAVRVTADVFCATPAAYRELFNKLKFRRLLYTLEHRENGSYRIRIDGPFSLFESVTKYGLELALTLPALEACDSLRLVADVLWGKSRDPLTFRLATQRQRADSTGERLAPMRDEVAELLDAFRALDSDWSARPTPSILDLPGVGVCIPDIEFVHEPSGLRVFLEVLGYWSREAVFRRIDLVERGLEARILFAVSSRLRVSEELLEGAESAALYVYKGTMSARAVERKLEALRRV